MIENLKEQRELKEKRVREILKRLLIENEVLTEDGQFGKNANNTRILDKCIQKALKQQKSEINGKTN